MADKKLNEVSQLTDFDYALVVKGNDVAKVTKQQLATILGELLQLIKYLSVKELGALNIDINMPNGLYLLKEGVTNAPPLSDPVNSLLIHIDLDGNIRYQLVIPYNNASIFYIRSRDFNGWKPWYKYSASI